MKSKGRICKRIFLILVIFSAVILLTAFLFLRHIAVRAIPDYNENIPLQHLGQPVMVYRDAYAVPYIQAQNETDLYRATGYLQAQDRLWQMDMLRRVSVGRLAEIFGPELVETDLLMRSLRIPEKSARILKHASPEIRRALAAFADGVNQFIDNNRDTLPPEFFFLNHRPEKWHPIHSLNLIGYMAWDLTSPWDVELFLDHLARKLPPEKYHLLFPNLKNHLTPVFPSPSFQPPAPAESLVRLNAGEKLEELGLGVLMGSNNWVISGSKSTTGKPILANDMHLGFSAPGIWLPMHQYARNSVHVSGLVLPGQPFIIAGHNDRIAWGMTNLMTDDMDFYLETTHPQDPNMYKLDGEWKKMVIRTETIAIRGGSKCEKILRFTHRGPVISQFHNESGRVISMRWTGNDDSNEVLAVYQLNRARNWKQFREAATGFISLGQNIVYADVDGNIGLQTAAGLPVRKNPGSMLAPGDTSTYDWKGYVPFAELPFVFNPASGCVASANNKTPPDDYPHYISLWFDLPERAKRIMDMLEQKPKLSSDDFKRMHGDVRSVLPQWLLPEIFKALDGISSWNALEKAVLDLLHEWDGAAEVNSSGALVFERLSLELYRELIRDELGPDLTRRLLGRRMLLRNLLLNMFTQNRFEWCDDIATPDVAEGKPEWIVKGFRSAVKQLIADSGPNIQSWRWGDHHRLTFRHPLGRIAILDRLFHFNRGSFPVGGSYHTPCVYSYSFNKPYHVTHGASHRHIYSPGAWDESLSVIPMGVSGIPASVHYDDQSPLFAANDYHKDLFSPAAVKQRAKYKMRFIPPQFSANRED